MGRNLYIAAILLFLVAVDSSDAFFLLNFRKLIGLPPNDLSATRQISPQPSSVPAGKELNQSKVDADKPGKNNTTNAQLLNNSVSDVPKSSKSQHSNTDSHTNEVMPKTDDSKLVTVETCDGSAHQCRDQKSIRACIWNSTSGPKELVFLIQNEGESTLIVNLTIESPEEKVIAVEIPKHASKKVSVPGVNTLSTSAKSMKIVLKAGNGECEIHLGPSVSRGNFIKQLSLYSKQVTPIYGAYFILLVTLILGGTWACCMLKKRKRHDGVPYQELEMGLPESAADVDTAEGWDQGWDDDWDEENAVKSPGGHRVAGISANGLTSRSSKKDGWERDWEED